MTKILIDRKLAQRIVNVLWANAPSEVYEEFNAALATPADDVQKDAARYRWLRGAHPATEAVIAWGWQRNTHMRYEELDSAVDAAIDFDLKEQAK